MPLKSIQPIDISMSNQGHVFLDFDSKKNLEFAQKRFSEAEWITWIVENPREARIKHGKAFRLGVRFR